MFGDAFRVTPRSRKVKLKKRRGVLFRNPGIVGRITFYFGTGLLLVALAYGIYLYYPLGKAIVNYWAYQHQKSTVNEPPIAAPTITPNNSQEYSITIPKILAYSKIVENVSPFNSEEYLKVLENNVVAQAKDTSKIGEGVGKMTYLFAHSSQEGIDMVRKNSVFYLLGELNDSDVMFINNRGTIYTYQVYKQQVVNANQVEFLKYTEPDKEIIILQTCWPIGTDWKRLLVFAKRVK